MRQASSIGTFVNRDLTSKLTSISSGRIDICFALSTKCLEFLMYDVPLPARGSNIFARCFAKL